MGGDKPDKALVSVPHLFPQVDPGPAGPPGLMGPPVSRAAGRSWEIPELGRWGWGGQLKSTSSVDRALTLDGFGLFNLRKWEAACA